jgi:hypothetical protein
MQTEDLRQTTCILEFSDGELFRVWICALKDTETESAIEALKRALKPEVFKKISQRFLKYGI